MEHTLLQRTALHCCKEAMWLKAQTLKKYTLYHFKNLCLVAITVKFVQDLTQRDQCLHEHHHNITRTVV